DFADLFEVRGLRRNRRGTREPPLFGRSEIGLGYRGLDGVRRDTRLYFEPAPARLEENRAVFELDLAARGRTGLFIEIRCEGVPSSNTPRERYLISLRDARRVLRASAGRAASVETSNQIFNEAMHRSVSDLYMLVTDQPEGPFPYAGIPWFSTVF